MANCTTTRSQGIHYVFGKNRTLPNSQLSTYVDVFRYAFLLKMQQPKRSSINDFVSQIAIDLLDIWERAFIPTVTKKDVEGKLRYLFTKNDSYQDIVKSVTKKQKDSAFISKKFGDFNQLFDIAYCASHACVEYLE